MATQALRFAENLTLPKVQVVVMKANMRCTHCRQRVSSIVSKMNAGMLDYMVDLQTKEVTVRGMVDTRKKKKKNAAQGFPNHKDKKFPCCFGLLRFMCLRAF